MFFYMDAVVQCRFLRLLGKGKRGPAGTQNANSGSGMREPKAGVTISHAIHVPIHGSACWCAVCMGAVNSDGPHGYVLRGLVVYYCSDMNSDDCQTLCIVWCELVALCWIG